MDASIVEYFAEHDGYRCGYCKGTDSNHSYGMWGHALTTSDYEGLLNRGFRRSGKYLYKPINDITCCPSYTIKLHALEFELSKSQKKVLKKVSRYLRTGVNPKLHRQKDGNRSDEEEDTLDGAGGVTEEISYKEAQDIDMKPVDDLRMQPAQVKRSAEEVPYSPQSPTKLPHNARNPSPTGKGKCHLETRPTVSDEQQTEPSKNLLPKKKKQLRIERKRQKLIAQGKLNEDEPMQMKKKSTSQPKSLEDFLADETKDNPKLKLTFKLVHTKSPEFKQHTKIEHALYQKYQMAIHDDSKDECSEKQFRRFLCDNPLLRPEDADDDHLEGAYHQQYWLGSELIAVGVLDILPHVVSSVYFFYDPAYSFLSLGTYAALREIAFTRQWYQTQPELKYYYMGYYIHSCPKMRYKGAYSPSYLLCPERFTWVRLTDEIRRRLDQQKYQRLDTSPPTGGSDEEPRRHDIQKVQIFFRQCVLPYPIYELKRGCSDRDLIQQYCDLVGEKVASSMLLYRS